MSLRLPAACLALVGSAGSTGCATVLGSSSDSMILQGHPGADVFVDGAYHGKEPLVIELTNHSTHVIAVGDQSRPIATCTLVPGIGLGWIVLDVIFIELLFPIIVDAVSGNWSTIDTGPCNL